MPSQKRPLSEDDQSPPPQEKEDMEEETVEQKQPKQKLDSPKKEEDLDDDDDEGEESGLEKDEFVFVKLADIRKEVQCPICLGIIRKTRTVMECLHRFCRECINKSMRLGNNECPACRTHCPSRRSLRDDPNYDALISAIYPNIDKYEEEELAFDEDEKSRNKKIQADIAETLRRQTEALGKKKTTAKATARAFIRKSKYGRTQGRSSARNSSLAESDEEEDDAKSNNDRDSSSADELSSNNSRAKRCKRWPTPLSSPGKAIITAPGGEDNNNDMGTSRENIQCSQLKIVNREIPVWGKGGVRSQTRHGSSNGANGRFIKGGRVSKLVDHFRTLQENDNEFDVHLTLLPKDEQSARTLERPYICCRPTVTIGQLCQYVAIETSAKAQEVEVFARKPQNAVKTEPVDSAAVKSEDSLASLRDSFTNSSGDLVLEYRIKMQSL